MESDSIRYIPLRYDSANSHDSALSLILALRPDWQQSQQTIEFVRFTDGITNTVCQRHAARPRPPLTTALNAPTSSSKPSTSCPAGPRRKSNVMLCS